MNPPVKTSPAVSITMGREQNMEVDVGSVFFDPPKAPEDQASYKCVWLEEDGLHIAYTYQDHDYCQDKSTWDSSGVQNPVFPYYPDGENTVMYDPRIDRYVAYFRQWIPRPGSDDTCEEADPRRWFRTVGRLEIEDPLKPWCPPPDEACHIKVGANYPPVPGPEFETVLACDEDDPPDCDFYRHGIMRYPWADTVYLAFPTLYRHFPEDPEEEWKNDGLCDVQLATSRDGIHWRRFRRSYIRLGPWGSEDCAIIYSGRWLVRDGDQLRQYYDGYSKSHATLAGSNGNPVFKGMVTQRLDGFVSADASYAGGELTTPLLVFTGNRLELNIDTSAVGEARVELLDSGNRPISGFTLSDANLIQGNCIRKVVTWRTDEGDDVDDLSALQSKPVRIRFVMRAAKLYAFQFTTPNDTRDEICPSG